MGADVIKVERPTGGDAGRAHPYFKDGQSGYFLQQNMGKRGLCLNLKDPRGMALMRKLAKTADVFVENFRPGALAKLGLGYGDLAAENPGLVYCSVSAYGHTGPKSARPGFGLIAEAISGAMAQLGREGEPPPLMRMPIADMYTGVHGVAAISAALLGRVKSGRGTAHRPRTLRLHDLDARLHDPAILPVGWQGRAESGPDRSSRNRRSMARSGQRAASSSSPRRWTTPGPGLPR